MPPRSSSLATQAKALRALASELEAGKRQLSPAMAKALRIELAGGDEADFEELSRVEWERVWATEIDGRLADLTARRAGKVDLGTVLEGLRDRIR